MSRLDRLLEAGVDFSFGSAESMSSSLRLDSPGGDKGAAHADAAVADQPGQAFSGAQGQSVSPADTGVGVNVS
jgi:hypothetical protein